MALIKKYKMAWLLTVCCILLLLVPSHVYAITYTYVYADEIGLAETNAYNADGRYDALADSSDLAADQAYDYTDNIDLETNGYYGTWITLEHDSSGTTDDIIISYFASNDGTNFDDVELWSITCDASTGADTQISFLLCPAPPHGRIGVKTSSTNDTFDYQLAHKPFRGDGT